MPSTSIYVYDLSLPCCDAADPNSSGRFDDQDCKARQLWDVYQGVYST